MRYFHLTVTAIVLLMASCSQAPKKKPVNWDIKEIKKNNIFFRNGKSIETGLTNIKVLGQLETMAKAPYLILGGNGCKNCDTSLALFLHSVSDGAKLDLKKWFSYPGKQVDSKTRNIMREVWFFFGHCLVGQSNIAIWYTDTRTKENKWEKSATVVSLENDELIIREVRSQIPDINQTIKLVEEKVCQEVLAEDRKLPSNPNR